LRYNNRVTPTPLKMERASRFLGKLTRGGGPIDVDDLARAAWPLAVGKKVAARTRPARMVRTRLIVEVEDPIWKKQLFALSRQILANLERHLGQGIVEDLEFRVCAPSKLTNALGGTCAASGTAASAARSAHA
jgi:predicted nucleic acid-binding Zn ribbon protein